MAKKQNNDDERVGQARALVAALEQGDDTRADQILTEIGRLREVALFQEVGKLTRQLHDTLSSFALDSKLAELTEREIPDAKERLNYVIAMTEQAANTTLNAVESIMPLAEILTGKNDELSSQWQRFRQREMPVEEFRSLTQELAGHFDETRTHLQTMQSRLTDVLMAQGFQDLTGQIIRRVIQLVQDLEVSMVEIVRISGRRYAPAEAEPAPKLEPLGPSIPGLDTGAVESQDDVDALLSSLGF